LLGLSEDGLFCAKVAIIYHLSTDKGRNFIKIWIRFFQADSSRTTDNSGLGLPMVKGIIEAHNGNISVTSELGKGTTFSIILPFLEKI